jgi:hypothetical protein
VIYWEFNIEQFDFPEGSKGEKSEVSVPKMAYIDGD